MIHRRHVGNFESIDQVKVGLLRLNEESRSRRLVCSIEDVERLFKY